MFTQLYTCDIFQNVVRNCNPRRGAIMLWLYMVLVRRVPGKVIPIKIEFSIVNYWTGE